MEIIGLSGFARSGKDEAAKVLVEEFGFTRIAFADKLREVLYALDPIVVADSRHHGPVPEPDYSGTAYRRLQDIINTYGWDGYKTSPFSNDIRRLLQRLGTEAGREVLGTNIWVDSTLNNLDPNGSYVVTDARFYNEFDAIRSRGGVIWRVERKGLGPLNDHASEMEAVGYPHFELTILNDGTVEEYHSKVRNLMYVQGGRA